MKIALCDDDEKELSNIRSLLDSYQKTHNIPFTYQEYHSMLPILFFLQPHRILRWKVIR